jgi:DNA-binding PadR family transcriptional regulator
MNWDEVRPVLEAAYRLMDQDDEGSTWPDAVSAELGKPQDPRIVRILGQLYDAGYITGATIEQSPAPISIEATEKGLQLVAGWPTPDSRGLEIERLLSVLDERITDESRTPDERGRLRRFRDSVVDIGRDVGSEVLGAYLARMTGAS